MVSIDGSESGIGLVLVRGSIGVAPERNAVETRLLLAVLLSLFPSLIPDFSLDRALVTGCALPRIFLGVVVRGLERGVAAETNGVGFTLVLFCVSVVVAFFLPVVEAGIVLLTLVRFARAETLPAMEELSLPPSLVPSPPVVNLTSSGKVAHGSS